MNKSLDLFCEQTSSILYEDALLLVVAKLSRGTNNR